MSPYKGAQCLQLSCAHVFCRTCLSGFWTVHVTDGDIGKVGCPDPRCVKGRKEASEEEVKRVVGPETFERWKSLRDKRTFESGTSSNLRPTNIKLKLKSVGIAPVYCPMSHCGAPVPYVKRESDSPAWELFRSCTNCGFTFCSYCLHAWSVLAMFSIIVLTHKHWTVGTGRPANAPGKSVNVLWKTFSRRKIYRKNCPTWSGTESTARMNCTGCTKISSNKKSAKGSSTKRPFRALAVESTCSGWTGAIMYVGANLCSV